MNKFNNGKAFHGSDAVQKGRLRGTTNTDYFYFLCPHCPDEEVLRILEYGEVGREDENRYNAQLSPKAKGGFTLAFKIHCQKCGFDDFVKISNTGLQGGPVDFDQRHAVQSNA